MEQVTGSVTDIVYRNDANYYTGFEVQTEYGALTCTGSPASIRVGEILAMTGEYRMHPTYGRQFAMERFEVQKPEGAAAILRYLGSGAVRGIGETLAGRIVKKFGDDTLTIMEEQPERLAEIKGISLRKAREIAAGMEEQRDSREVFMYLAQFGLTTAMAGKIYRRYGQKTYEILRQNPYQLAEDITGIGFARADEIASRMGVRADSDFRVRSGILYMLSQVLAEGSTWIARGELVQRTAEMLGVEPSCVEIQIGNLSVQRKLFLRTPQETEAQAEFLPFDENGQWQEEAEAVSGTAGSAVGEESDRETQVYPADAWYREQQIARMLLDLDSVPLSDGRSPEEVEHRIRELERSEKIELDDLQRSAACMAVSRAVLLISGGPGTGKTTTINTIIRSFGGYGGTSLRTDRAGSTAHGGGDGI